MEKIEILLEKLDNRITSALAKRLDSYEDLNDELNTLGQEYENDPSDENRVKYNKIINSFEEIESGIIEDLEALLKNRKAEELAKVQANQSAPASNPSSNPTTEKEEKKEEKKEGIGVLTLVVGSIFFVASLGALNYFRKR